MAESLTDIAVRLEGVRTTCESNEKRISDLEMEMKELRETQISLVKIANSVENMSKPIIELNTKVDNMSEKQDIFSEQVTALENKPSQNTKRIVDDIFEKVAWVIIGGFVVWGLSHFFPGVG